MYSHRHIAHAHKRRLVWVGLLPSARASYTAGLGAFLFICFILRSHCTGRHLFTVAINPWKPVNRSYIYSLRMHPTVVTLELDAITNKIRKLWMTLYCLLLQPLCLYDCNTGVVSRARPLRVRIRGAAKPH